MASKDRAVNVNKSKRLCVDDKRRCVCGDNSLMRMVETIGNVPHHHQS